MESFEDGCVVSLRFHCTGVHSGRHPFRYASMTEHASDHTAAIYMNTSDHCKDTFKLTKHSDGTISLQNSGGWFLSPDGDQWTFRGWCDRWERLHVQPRSCKVGETLVSLVTLCAMQHSRFDLKDQQRISSDVAIPQYLNAAADISHNCTASSDPNCITEWEMVLADIPIISMAGVNRLEICTTPSSAVSRISDTSRHFILKVLRAMQEIGSFHITGHGGNTDWYSLVHKSIGLLPWRELEGDESEERDYKECFDLLNFKSGKLTFSRYTQEYLKTYLQYAKDYFDFSESLCDFLLHSMALAAALALGHTRADTWRWTWGDGQREMGLSTSTYYPGG
jgi:hypothetical protein